MKLGLKIAALGLLFGSAAFADDAPTDAPVKSPGKKMHECMVQQKAADPSKSHADLKKACAAQLKMQENHPSVPAAPNNAPQS